MKNVMLFFIGLIFPIVCHSQDALEELLSAKSLVCNFPVGNYADWSGNTLKIQNDKMSDAVHIDNINLNTNTARMIGNIASRNVTVLSTASGLTFLEITKKGDIVYITVFPAYAGEKLIPQMNDKDLFKMKISPSFIAVMSRHLFGSILTNAPIPGQFHGFCRLLEP